MDVDIGPVAQMTDIVAGDVDDDGSVGSASSGQVDMQTQWVAVPELEGEFVEEE